MTLLKAAQETLAGAKEAQRRIALLERRFECLWIRVTQGPNFLALTAQEQDVIALRIHEYKTLTEVGLELGLSREECKAIDISAWRKMGWSLVDGR